MKIIGAPITQVVLANLLSSRRKNIEEIMCKYISMLDYVADDINGYWSGRALMRINAELSEYDLYVGGEL